MQLPENICTVTNKMAGQEARSQRTVSLKGSRKSCHEELLTGSQSVSLQLKHMNQLKTPSEIEVRIKIV